MDELHDLIRQQAEEMREQAEEIHALRRHRADDAEKMRDDAEKMRDDSEKIRALRRQLEDLPLSSATLSDYYERLYIVSRAQANISPERDSRDLQKQGMGLKTVDMEKDGKLLKDLGITCTIALSLVREAKRDVAAVHMAILPGNKLKFLVSKNDLSSSDTDAHKKDSILCHARTWAITHFLPGISTSFCSTADRNCSLDSRMPSRRVAIIAIYNVWSRCWKLSLRIKSAKSASTSWRINRRTDPNHKQI